MGVTYFKRYRMEFDLGRSLFAPPPLPPGYRLIPWSDALLAAHAEVKYLSFREEIDAHVFPCLGEREGCRRLMQEITRRDSFIESATWLIEFTPPSGEPSEACGTIQGLRDAYGMGAVQNIGVTPEHRGKKLGSVLIHHALKGFAREGLRRGSLEVTAQNTGALRLYHRLGFQKVRTVYKAAEVVYA